MKSIYDNILAEIRKKQKDTKTKTTIDELYSMAAGYNLKDEEEIRYAPKLHDEFNMAIDKLFEEQILSPRDSKKVQYSWLYKNFWIAKKEISFDKQLYAIELMKYADEFNMIYYNKRYDEFQEDREYIDILYRYVKQDNKEYLTSNELGYLLFKDEKAFEKSDKNQADKKKQEKKAIKILNNIGIDLKKLNSYETIEPFFCFTKKSFYEKQVRKILVIENKDTFFSLIKLNNLIDDCNYIINLDYDMFIYGEGQKINKSFELADMYYISNNDIIKYFGDIDPAGFSIYATLLERFNKFNISLATDMYKVMVDGYSLESLSTIRNNQDIYNKDIVLEVVKNEFESKYEQKIMNIVYANKYIPQEAISLLGLIL